MFQSSPSGSVALATDLGVDLGQAVTVEAERGAVPGLDRRLGGLGPRRAEGGGVVDARAPAACRAGPGCASSPIDAPRPSDGLVHAHESATATTPVATGAPSTVKRRWRSSILAMTTTRSSRGSPSSQCATRGRLRTDAVQRSMWRSSRMALSAALAMTPTPQVPLSAGSVSDRHGAVGLEEGPHDRRGGAVGESGSGGRSTRTPSPRAPRPGAALPPTRASPAAGSAGRWRRPPGRRGSPPPSVGPDAGDMGHTPDGLGAGHETTDGDAPPHRHSRGAAAAAAAITASTTGRRPVTEVKSPSPGRDPAGHLHRGARDGVQPQRARRLEVLDHWGSSRSSSKRKRGRRKCSSRN